MVDSYKIIDLPNFSTIQQLLRIALKTINIPTEDGVFPFVEGVDLHSMALSMTPLVDSMKQIGLFDSWVATSLVLTYKEIPIHKDNAQEFDYSLNLPIINTENTFTTFYSTKETPTTKYLPNGLPYDAYDTSQCVVEDRVEIVKPTLLNVKIPHGVSLGDCNIPRITLALRLNHCNYM